MSIEAHHRDALIETARSELERAHRAALAVEAGELRRGMTLAVAALRQAGDEAASLEPLERAWPTLTRCLTEMVASSSACGRSSPTGPA